MNALSLGPFVLAGDRFAAVLGLFVFLASAAVLERHIDPAFRRWSWWTLLGGIAAARIGHVAMNWPSFAPELSRALALWQGGFAWEPAAAVIGASLVLCFRSRRLRLWALTPLCAGLAAWLVAGQLAGGTRPLASPQIALEDLDGRPVAMGDTGGRPKIINLWASWCPPCRREMPMMAEVAAETADIEFLFVNQGEGDSAIRQYLQSEKLSLGTVLLDPAFAMSGHYDVPGLPATLFVGLDGTLKEAHLGEISREVLIEAMAGLNPRPNLEN